ncbi:MAG: ABC transporter ATP-binding protein [Arachnia propionica]|uniref:ABC transporter ATP-binding protein n=1 Tax=Arachnia propionica TaxID=1750 RepID=UPI00270E83CF|nr:ABC transporter ATP-binding protein [Arachnia propionica]
MSKIAVSNSSRRSTHLVGTLRILSAALTGMVLVLLGTHWGSGDTSLPWPWLILGILGAGLAAFGEILLGGRAARREERRLRAELLSAHLHNRVRPLAAAPASPRPPATNPLLRPWRGRGHRGPVIATPATPSQLVGLMTDNTERMTEYRQVYLGSTLAALAIPFLTLAFVTVALDVVVGLGILMAVPVVPCAILGFLRLFRKVSATSRKERGRLSVHYLDALRNLVPIRLFGAGPRIEDRLRTQGEANRRAIMRLLAGNQIVIIVLDGVFSLALICWSVFLIGGRLHSGELSPGAALAIALLLTLLLEPLTQVAGFFYIGMGGMASERAISRQLSLTTVDHRPTDLPARPTAAAISVQSVSHDHGRGTVLDALGLEVARGSKVAIMGPSGVGKSTLLSLLRGTLPLQSGAIVLDGHDLGTLSPEETAALSATVAQSTWLFTGTVADNLRLARPEASDEELWQALRMAHVADEVARMPSGLDSPVGERGQLISGGQAQRISLARAFLSGRKILLLDEPTSQVDIASEAAIIDALADLGPEWTVLVVTHRRSLLRIVDEAHELVDGTLRPLEVAR